MFDFNACTYDNNNMKNFWEKIIIWAWTSPANLEWLSFLSWIIDTAQKVGIAGLALGIYSGNSTGIVIGLLFLAISGAMTLLIKRR